MSERLTDEYIVEMLADNVVTEGPTFATADEIRSLVTGEPFHDEGLGYVGTFQLQELVFHLFHVAP